MSTYVAPSARTSRPSRTKRPPSLTAGASAARSGGVSLCRGQGLAATADEGRTSPGRRSSQDPARPRVYHVREAAREVLLRRSPPRSRTRRQRAPRRRRGSPARSRSRSARRAPERRSSFAAGAGAAARGRRVGGFENSRPPKPREAIESVSSPCLAFASRAASRNNAEASRQPSAAKAATAMTLNLRRATLGPRRRRRRRPPQ